MARDWATALGKDGAHSVCSRIPQGWQSPDLDHPARGVIPSVALFFAERGISRGTIRPSSFPEKRESPSFVIRPREESAFLDASASPNWRWSSYRTYALGEEGMVKINQWPKAVMKVRSAA